MSIMSDEHAVYLPAVNVNYARTLAAKGITRGLPKGLTLDDLAFWKPESGLWHHPQFLHSVGQYKVGADPSNAITCRGLSEGVLFGDSAGYQLGNGNLKGVNGLESGMSANQACAVWRDSVAARDWIVNWLETYTNYAMTIDIPLWATLAKHSGSPFHACSQEQITQLTVENLHYIDNRPRGDTKWLNVIQGLDARGMVDWWNAVKWFDCSGYAFSVEAGKTMGLRGVLEPLLVMRDEGAFESGHDWLHMLGSSGVYWAIVYTAIQRAIRSEVNPELRVSFDSSSPFQKGAIYEDYAIMPSFAHTEGSWGVKWKKAPQSHLHVNSSASLPFSSPIADRLTLGDLNVNSDAFACNHFDQLSHLYLMNHNTWVYLTAFETANRLIFAQSPKVVPMRYAGAAKVVERAFKEENWHSYIDKYATSL